MLVKFYLNAHTSPWRPKTRRRLEDRELNQARSKPDTLDQPVRIARTFVHHCAQYCNTETVFSVFPFLQTNITSQNWPRGGKGVSSKRLGMDGWWWYWWWWCHSRFSCDPKKYCWPFHTLLILSSYPLAGMPANSITGVAHWRRADKQWLPPPPRFYARFPSYDNAPNYAGLGTSTRIY